MPEYRIDIVLDNESAVWTATSDDIPGLVLESDSFDALIERVGYAAPELLSLNGMTQKALPIYFNSEWHKK